MKFLSEVEEGHPDNSTPLDKHVYCALSNLKYLIIKITEDQFAVSINPKSPPSCVQDNTLTANIRQKEICCLSPTEAVVIIGDMSNCLKHDMLVHYKH